MTDAAGERPVADGPGRERLRVESRVLTGWGRTAPSRSDVVIPRDPSDAAEAIVSAGQRGVIARGLGRGYGDCAQNAGGQVLDGPAMSGLLDVDLTRNEVRALAGTSLDDLMRWLVPLGMFVPVTPGTRMVTVGGAIAADVHGKNHHVKGSFANHVASFRMIDGRGELRDISPASEPEVFWATAGGMGLTGVIVDATIRMTPIEASLLSVDTDRTSDLDEVMAMMVEGDARYEYSVAWVDLAAKGKHLGRSILDRGRFVTRDEAEASGVKDLYRYVPKNLPSPPDVLPPMVNQWTIRAFNQVWYRKSPVRRRNKLMSIEQFFHPLDMVAAWNRVYGQRGFLQYQFLVPDDEHQVVRDIVRGLAQSGHASPVTVLKRFGPGNDGYLSFPFAGWTLTVDIPVVDGLDRQLDAFDDLVVAANGRVYLAKDSRVRPELMPAMYPRLSEWREIRDKLDPSGRFHSDLSRRLHLT